MEPYGEGLGREYHPLKPTSAADLCPAVDDEPVADTEFGQDVLRTTGVNFQFFRKRAPGRRSEGPVRHLQRSIACSGLHGATPDALRKGIIDRESVLELR